jgi:hypothetical protein
MRISGLFLIVTLAAGCNRAPGDEPKQAGDERQAQPLVQGESAVPVGSTGAGTGSGRISEPGIASPATANETAVALADFKKRVDAYAELHKELAKGSAKQRESTDPTKINDAQSALATKVQSARSQAKQGDLFTPAVRPIFRRLLAPELKGAEGRDTKAILEDDAPAPGTVPFKVNGKYPDAQPLPTVPANVLATLPELPAPLEYRIIGQHLVLLDTASGVIADYMLNAITK